MKNEPVNGRCIFMRLKITTAKMIHTFLIYLHFFFSFPLRFLTIFLIVDYIEYLYFFDQEKAMCIFESNKLRACMP